MKVIVVGCGKFGIRGCGISDPGKTTMSQSSITTGKHSMHSVRNSPDVLFAASVMTEMS